MHLLSLKKMNEVPTLRAIFLEAVENGVIGLTQHGHQAAEGHDVTGPVGEEGSPRVRDGIGLIVRVHVYDSSHDHSTQPLPHVAARRAPHGRENIERRYFRGTEQNISIYNYDDIIFSI